MLLYIFRNLNTLTKYHEDQFVISFHLMAFCKNTPSASLRKPLSLIGLLSSMLCWNLWPPPRSYGNKILWKPSKNERSLRTTKKELQRTVRKKHTWPKTNKSKKSSWLAPSANPQEQRKHRAPLPTHLLQLWLQQYSTCVYRLLFVALPGKYLDVC